MDTRAPDAAHAAVDRHVTALYQAHALSLARLALLMLSDRDAAQDVVQDAFLGLYRRWDKLASADAAPAYLRASVPAALHGTRNAPHACDTPFLTGNGQAVVCGNSTYSPGDKRLSAVWLAYPLATPARPRVIGSVQEPRGVSSFNGSISVEWANPSGTKVIGSWNPAVELPQHGEEVTNYEGVIENGKVKPFHRVLGPAAAW